MEAANTALPKGSMLHLLCLINTSSLFPSKVNLLSHVAEDLMARYQSSIDLLMVRKQTSTNMWNYFFRESSYITATIGFLFLQYSLYRFKYLSQCSLASTKGSSFIKIKKT